MRLLVYALASRGTPPVRLAGVRGERLETIRIGSIDAIAGAVSAVPRSTARTLRHYDHVVRAVWARRSAVLPARFGTVMRDRRELALVVGARRESLQRQLALVRNRAQMTVRVVEGATGKGAREKGADPLQARSGAEYLRARAGRYEIAALAPVRAAVRRWIRAEKVEKRGSVATVYHLVPRAAAPAYRSAAERAAASAQISVHLSGPWPPYAFAESW
ncbi:MAG: GvpL/GvpF family gas vesicle protein [Acidobacteria bacterium]|nr:GvpL/GvpF family gas vesicle protein [Acidobacteriota bacterium]